MGEPYSSQLELLSFHTVSKVGKGHDCAGWAAAVERSVARCRRQVEINRLPGCQARKPVVAGEKLSSLPHSVQRCMDGRHESTRGSRVIMQMVVAAFLQCTISSAPSTLPLQRACSHAPGPGSLMRCMAGMMVCSVCAACESAQLPPATPLCLSQRVSPDCTHHQKHPLHGVLIALLLNLQEGSNGTGLSVPINRGYSSATGLSLWAGACAC